MPIEDEDDVEVLKMRKLCFRCVGEAFLKEEIRTQGGRGKCSYCGKTRQQYGIGAVADRVETAFEQHYQRTASEPDAIQYMMLKDRESTYDWEREGEPTVWAIQNAADIKDQAATDIQRILADRHADYDGIEPETEFGDEVHYEEKGTDDARWQEEWRNFERALKTEARFFSQSAARLLASVFDGIDTMRTHEGRPLIVEAGPGQELNAIYRARVFQSHEKLEGALARADRHLGSPPSAAAAAGRMNARGISVFYGANSALVSLSEVRPPVGSHVVVARFEIIRSLRLLDLPALSAVTTDRGSIFDPTYNDRLERAMFLRNLSSRITRPVMPDDEPAEYLATQAIADFLATENAIPLDGIIFPSVQVAGEALNIVLFHKAASVERIEVPPATDIRVSSGHWEDDGWETEYSVTEWVPPKDAEMPAKDPWDFEDVRTDWTDDDFDPGLATLRIDLQSVYVHRVQAVIFKTEDHNVAWRRYEKHNSDF